MACGLIKSCRYWKLYCFTSKAEGEDSDEDDGDGDNDVGDNEAVEEMGGEETEGEKEGGMAGEDGDSDGTEDEPSGGESECWMFVVI